MQNDLLTIKEASNLLNCHPNTLRLWEQKGLIKPIRFGIRRDRKYRRAEILKLLELDKQETSLQKLVLPSNFDLTRIDMTGTYYEGLNEETMSKFANYSQLNCKIIENFDFDKFLAKYNKLITDFPTQEMNKFPTLAEKILHIITSNRYRNGSLETINLDKYKDSFIQKIESHIIKNEPITFMLPAFPFKIANPLKSFRGDADLAEVGAFARFNEINLQIKKIYQPGAQFHVFHDGHLYFRHFLHDETDADRYFASMQKFIKAMNLEKVILLKNAFEELEQIDNFDQIYQEARKEMTNLWQKGKFSNEKIQTIIQSAKNNVKLSDIPYDVLYKINFAEDWDLTHEEKKLKKQISARADKCAFEYMVVQHALEKADFFNKIVPSGIRLTVHPKEGHIGVFLVKRKTHLLPWMGVGVLKNDGAVSVHYESELISNGKYFPVFIKGEKFPFYYQEAETIYQGEIEFTRLFDRVLDSLEKDDYYWAFAFHMEYMDERIRDILKNIHTKLAQKGIEDKAICRADIYQTLKDTYHDNYNIQIKTTTNEIPVGVIILKDRIINLIWSDEPAAYEIKTKEVVEKYQKYFINLWEKNWETNQSIEFTKNVLNKLTIDYKDESLLKINNQEDNKRALEVANNIEKIENNWSYEYKSHKKEFGQKVQGETIKLWSVPKTTAELLEYLVVATNSKKILEIGTSAGYSTLYLAMGAKYTNGQVYTIENLPPKADLATTNFKKSQLDNIHLLQGDASKLLTKDNLKDIDFIFLDADKENYGKYFDLFIPYLKKGGLIVADNVFDYGHMMHDYLNKVLGTKFPGSQSDRRVQSFTLPLDNGVIITKKISN